MDGALEYSRDAGLGEVDRVLLRGAASRKSPNELAALVPALTPAEAAQRVLSILEKRDWLTEAQERMLIVDEMHRLKDRLWEQVENYRDKDAYRPLIQTLQMIEKTMSSNKLDYEKAMKELDAAHARIMLMAISISFEKANLELERLHPEIPGLGIELKSIFQTVFPETVANIEGHVRAIEQ